VPTYCFCIFASNPKPQRVECGAPVGVAKARRAFYVADSADALFLHSHPTPKPQRLNAGYLSLSDTDSKMGVAEKPHVGGMPELDIARCSVIESMAPSRWSQVDGAKSMEPSRWSQVDGAKSMEPSR
jgi:hypothetical protein